MAKINRITRSSSSLVTLAELQSGSQIFTKTSINRTQITPALTGTAALVKRAEVIRRVIDHIIYTDTVSGVQIFAEYLLPVDSALINFIRGRFQDDFLDAPTDRSVLTFNKQPKDVQQVLENLKLLTVVVRQFEESLIPQSRPSLSLDKPLQPEELLATDAVSVGGAKFIFEELLAADFSSLLAVFVRTITEDLVAAEALRFDITNLRLEDISVDEASSLEPAKFIFEDLLSVDERRFSIDKSFTDITPAAEKLALLVDLTRAETLLSTDVSRKLVGVNKTEDIISSDFNRKRVTKPLVDNVDLAEAAFKRLLKFFADTVIPQDLANVFDGITYNFGLSRALNVTVSDIFARSVVFFRSLPEELVSIADLAVTLRNTLKNVDDDAGQQDDTFLLPNKGLADLLLSEDESFRLIVASRNFSDDAIFIDTLARDLTTRKFDDVFISENLTTLIFRSAIVEDNVLVQDVRSFAITKGLQETSISVDQLFIDVTKPQADTAAGLDAATLQVLKTLADTAITSDLTGIFDGLNYQAILGRVETATISDAFVRRFVARRSIDNIASLDDLTTVVRGLFFVTADDLDASQDTATRQIGSGFSDAVSITLSKRTTFDITKQLDTRFLNIDDYYIDSPQDSIVNRELGRGFSGSELFDADSATSGVNVVASGTGAGQTGGFYAPGILNVGVEAATPAGGNYIGFQSDSATSSPVRSLVTKALNTTTGQNIVFTYIAGDNANGGDRPEAGEDLILEYSTDNKVSFTTAATIWTGSVLWPNGTNWLTTSITMPAGSKTAATFWRWRQTGNPSNTVDNYGIFNIFVGTTSLSQRVYQYYDNNSPEFPDYFARSFNAVRGVRDGFTETIDLSLQFPNSSLFIIANASSTLTSVSTIYNATTSTSFYDMVWASGSVLIASLNANTSTVQRSTDNGQTWTASTALGITFASFARNSSTLVALGDPLNATRYSTNQGLTWNTATDGWTGAANDTNFYGVVWSQERQRFFAQYRYYVPEGGGKSPPPEEFNWVYVYSSGGDGTNWSRAGTVFVNSAILAYHPVGAAAGTPSSTSNSAVVWLTVNGNIQVIWSTTAIGAVQVLAADLPSSWPGLAVGGNFLTFGAGIFVAVTTDGTAYYSTSLTTWASVSLPGADAGSVTGVFWDTSISRFIAVGEEAAGIPCQWISDSNNSAAAWTQYITTGTTIRNAAFLRSALIPGSSTSGTSLLVSADYPTTNPSSSILVTQIYRANLDTYPDLPTPRTSGLASSTRLDFDKLAQRGRAGTVQIKTIDGNINPLVPMRTIQSSVLISYSAQDPDSVGALDQWSRAIGFGVRADDPGLAFVVVGRDIDDGIRKYNAAVEPETLKFAITKLIGDEAIPDDFLSTFDGLTYASTMLERDSVIAGLNIARRVSGSDVERTPFDITLVTKQGTNFTVSGVTVAAAARGEIVRVGQQSFAGNTLGRRNSGDGQERISFLLRRPLPLVDQAPSRVTPIDDSRNRSNLGKRETVVAGLNIARKVSGSNNERTPFNITMVAYRGVAGSTLIETIDVVNREYGVSSVAVGRGTRSVDDVGTLDSFFLTYAITRRPEDEVFITDGFTLGKIFEDSVTLSDVVTGDGLTYASTMLEREVVIAGLNIARRVSGSNNERTPFNITLVAKQGTNFTVSGVTISAAELGETLRVGQQDYAGNVLGVRSSGDGQERIRFLFRLRASALEPQILTVGADSGFRYQPSENSDENIVFRIGMRERETVVAGLNIARRVSGSNVERTPFDITKLMKQGTNFTVSGVTIAAAARGETVRIGQQYGGGRFSGDQQERISFTITKPLDVVEPQIIDVTDFAALTKQGLPQIPPEFISVGFGALESPGVRVHGSDLERIGIDFNLLAKQGANFTVSGVTIAAAARGETVRVGQQYGLIRFSRDRQERIVFDIIKDNQEEIVASDVTRDVIVFRRRFPEPINAGFGALESPGVRVHGSDLERISIAFRRNAYRGVVGQVEVKTIDAPNGISTSVLLNYGTRSPDVVGTVDLFSAFWAVGRPVVDSVSVGRSLDDGVRLYNFGVNPETLRFNITKLISDETIPDDLLETFDGLTYRITRQERDRITVTDRDGLDFGLLAKQGANSTVSGVTIAATARGETLRVGQQSFSGNVLGFRSARDGQENISFLYGLNRDESVLLGSGQDQRQRDEERIRFTITKRQINEDGTRDGAEITELPSLRPTIRAKQANYASYQVGAATRYFSSPEIVRGNLIKYSEDLTQNTTGVNWVSSNVTVTNVAFASPIGTTASKIAETATTAGHLVRAIVGPGPAEDSLASGSTITCSLYAKAAERNAIEIQFTNRVNQVGYVRFNLSSGTVVASGFLDTNPDLGDFSSITSTITAAGNGWYRCGVTFIKTNLGLTAPSYIYGPRITISNGTTSIYAGVAGSGLFVWGVQSELSDEVGPYIPTTSTQIIVARNLAGNNDFVLVGDPRISGTRITRSPLESITLDPSKGNNDAAISTDRFRTSSIFIRGAAFTQEFQPALGQYEGNFSYALTQGARRDDQPLDDFTALSMLFAKYPDDLSGDLDPFGNINTTVSNGSLRMTDYVDIEYLENDYVGESRSFS